MSEITTSQDTANQKEYHTPKLRKFIWQCQRSDVY